MRPLIVSIAIACLTAIPTSNAQAQTAAADTGDLLLVKDGEARGVIVASAPRSRQIQEAIDELQYHLNRASGVTLPIVDQKQSIVPGTVRIAFKVNRELPEETFHVALQGDTLTFTGDGRDNSTLQWAVDHYLDTQLGVRWLWPGEVGTHVPKRVTISLPQINYTGRPTLEQRNLRTSFAKRSFKTVASPSRNWSMSRECRRPRTGCDASRWAVDRVINSATLSLIGGTNTASHIPIILRCRPSEVLISNPGRSLIA